MKKEDTRSLCGRSDCRPLRTILCQRKCIDQRHAGVGRDVINPDGSRSSCSVYHSLDLILSAGSQVSYGDVAVGGRPPRYAPPLSSPRGRPSAFRRRADGLRRQRSSSFPRPTRSHAHRCSRPTRQHGDEQSGLVTLTFDLLTLRVVSESRVTWATSVPILVFLST